jgi:hypothetical protein
MPTTRREEGRGHLEVFYRQGIFEGNIWIEVASSR